MRIEMDEVLQKIIEEGNFSLDAKDVLLVREVLKLNEQTVKAKILLDFTSQLSTVTCASAIDGEPSNWRKELLDFSKTFLKN